jgi:hypothetical protein
VRHLQHIRYAKDEVVTMKMAVLQLNEGPKLWGVNSILHTPEVISLVEEKE